jgi:hypothetical protein
MYFLPIGTVIALSKVICLKALHQLFNKKKITVGVIFFIILSGIILPD